MMSGIGEILKAVGDFGPFQKRLVLLTLFPCLGVAFHQFCQLFMVPHLPHHCDTSWIRAVGPNLTEEEQLNLTLPRDADGAYEQCSMYSPVDWDLDSIVAYGLNATEECSSGWVYPAAQPPSLLTEFDLVCDRKELNDISQSIYMSGLFLGSLIFGPLSDRIGRRPVILISIFLQGLFGVGIAFVPHFYVYMAFRCVVGASVSGITMTILSLATEWVGASYRPKAVLISHCCFAIGQMLLAGLSYGIRNWRLLEIAGSAPMFALFFYIWVIPESARWLVTKGRIEEAKKVLQKAASINKRTIPPGLLEQLKPETKTKPGSVLDLFRKKQLRKVTLIMSCTWQTGVGLCSMLARVAGIMAPLIGLLTQYHRAIPMAIFGSVPMVGGLFCFLLPETCGVDLADDTGDGCPPVEVCENANSVSENGHMKGKDGGQDKDYMKTTYF
ncbi:solute carrier family 22 member 13-like isoform X2 [Chroicocephalus ridibundus]|uniref:solute carrier family 22 member 13-like isoform X2 n=1 Tax=Chroicocephalus ridibundus TaxID=1192867 RepID=UPI002FDCA621